MMPGMSIKLTWLPPFQGTPEIERTSATIQIRFGAENATRSWDVWSESVQDGARVAAYPLAMWLASSWWRIRWEPLPSRIRLIQDAVPAETNWRLNHELPAAGYGFIWPQLSFVSDGESIRVICRQSPSLSQEPVHYLSSSSAHLPPSFCAPSTPSDPTWAMSSLPRLSKTLRNTLGSQRWRSRAT